MNKILTDSLLKKYPVVFGQHKLPVTETAMCWGFSCGDGWYNIIDGLAFLIQRENEKLKENGENITIQAVQVKQKYGSLRFYTNYSTDYIEGAIHMAENMSVCICEECGSTDGVTQTTGWIRTLCKRCRRRYRRRELLLYLKYRVYAFFGWYYLSRKIKKILKRAS